MAEETTGFGAARNSNAAEDTTGAVATKTAEETREDEASKLVDRFSLWSAAAGLIPVPLVDIAAVGGVQLQMLRRLSEMYGIPFSDNRGKSIIATLAGSLIPASTATTTAMGVLERTQSHSGGRNGDRCADNASVLGLRHLGDRQSFHQAFQLGRDAS